MPSNDNPRRASGRPAGSFRPTASWATRRSELPVPVDVEAELAGDLAVLIQRGLIVELDDGGITRYGLAAASEHS